MSTLVLFWCFTCTRLTKLTTDCVIYCQDLSNLKILDKILSISNFFDKLLFFSPHLTCQHLPLNFEEVNCAKFLYFVKNFYNLFNI